MTAHLADLTQVANKSFDYVIAGGGTTGLCVASRLSEDPQLSVLVLEAGDLRVNDPLIDMPSGFPRQMGDPNYDWVFNTAPQKHVDNRSMVWHRGKGVGGSSNINYMAWTRPTVEDIDAWERLGNPGWNYKTFHPYLKKCERFHEPSQKVVARENLAVDPLWFGNEGAVSVSYCEETTGADSAVRESMKARGIPILQDAVNGQCTGTWCNTSSVDPRSQTRSSAATAYFLPNSGRSNLHLLTGVNVDRLKLEGGDAEPLTATGVEFRHGNKQYQVQAKREVILCAGALKSPQILELSGIGDKALLEPLGIDTKLHLPGVGKNVQDHIRLVGVVFEMRADNDIQTFDSLSDPAVLEKNYKLYSEKRQGLLALTVSSMTYPPLQAYSDRAHALVEAQLKKMSQDGRYPAPLLEQYHIQAERLKNPALHECEIVTEPLFAGFLTKPEPGKRYLSFVTVLNAPWSRGSIHVGSKDPSAQPIFDPHYLEEEIDLEIMVELYKFSRSIGQTEPFKSLVAKEAEPGPAVTSDDEIRSMSPSPAFRIFADLGHSDHCRQGLNSIYHTTGSLSMLPREKGGVVDPSLRVWGTKNIRVADMSIVPLQFMAHPQASVYAIAERAADLIRGRV